jgi:UDP-N-acetylglucosamine pyrophosphorylase
MRNELTRLCSLVKDPQANKKFTLEMDSFFALFTRYLTEKSKHTKLFALLTKGLGSGSLTNPKNGHALRGLAGATGKL